jgi:hypothetical protein
MMSTRSRRWRPCSCISTPTWYDSLIL